jgi:hypothetical protein
MYRFLVLEEVCSHFVCCLNFLKKLFEDTLIGMILHKSGLGVPQTSTVFLPYAKQCAEL